MRIRLPYQFDFGRSPLFGGEQGKDPHFKPTGVCLVHYMLHGMDAN
jgi:hypothetical protein